MIGVSFFATNMVDTIHIKIFWDELGDSPLSPEIHTYRLAEKYNLIRHSKSDSVFYSGNIFNFKVNANHEYLVLKGSLAKYHNGNNFTDFYRKDIETAFKSLQDELGFSLSNAIVQRIDFGCCLIMNYPINCYLESLLTPKRHHKQIFDSSYLNFFNSNKAITFYDKFDSNLSQLSKSGLEIEKDLVQNQFGKFVLRYEIRYLKKVAKQLNENEIRVPLLYDSNFYNKLCDRWILEFENIPKQKVNRVNVKSITPESLDITVLLEGYEALCGSLNNCLKFIDQMCKANNIDRSKKSRYKSKLIKIYNSRILQSPENSFILELEQQIRQRVLHNQ